MEKKIFSKKEIRHYLIKHFALDRLDSCGKGKEGILNYINKVACL
jgi:thioredoxin-related protein